MGRDLTFIPLITASLTAGNDFLNLCVEHHRLWQQDSSSHHRHLDNSPLLSIKRADSHLFDLVELVVVQEAEERGRLVIGQGYLDPTLAEIQHPNVIGVVDIPQGIDMLRVAGLHQGKLFQLNSTYLKLSF